MATGTRWNPPFHPHMLSSPPHTQTQNLARGYILEDTTNSTSGSMQRGVRFMYNPAQLSISHGINADSSPLPSDVRDSHNRGQVLGASQNSLSFSLLFDRTYDVWDSALAGTDQANLGVYADVRAIYDLVGLFQGADGSDLGTFNPNVGAFDVPLQYMVPVPAFFFFGTQGKSLSYYGYISSLGVNYTSWTRDMTPKRCEVTIGVTIWIPPAGNSQDALTTGNAAAPTAIQKKAMQY